MNKLLETTTKFPQTEVWNDSCSYDELEYAVKNGACGATTNPVIVKSVLESELSKWEPLLIKTINNNPTYTEDDVAWSMIKAMGSKASELLLPVYENSDHKLGRLSFQTNAKYYKDSDRMVQHAVELANTVPNSQIKAPTSLAGIQAFEEMTYQGISINATVSFTTAQAIAVAKAVERGLQRREAEGLDTSTMHPVCTIMVGRLDDYIKEVVKKKNLSISDDALEYAGVATFKHAYNIYKERGYRTKLLVAAYRNTQHWTAFIGGDVVLTIPYKWRVKFDESDIEVKESMSAPINEDLLNELLQIDEFKQAYYEDGLQEADFEHYGAFVKTMNQFLNGYDELLQIVRKYMVV